MKKTFSKKNESAFQMATNMAFAVFDTSSQSESLQRKADMANSAAQREEAPRPNNTGMPDNLKSGIESLSGFSMDDVRVHYNSSKPATVQALAYTQGTDIHVAPGQEKHLPHEAWHVAQQMAGRVSPTTNINGMPVNDNAALEHEADVMGEKAVQFKKIYPNKKITTCKNLIFQKKTAVDYKYQSIHFFDTTYTPQTEDVGKEMCAKLDPTDAIQGTEPLTSVQPLLMNSIKNAASIRTKATYSKNPYIKGHLLNHNLGGLGEKYNLAPLTSTANLQHEKLVEQAIKRLIFYDIPVIYHVTERCINGQFDVNNPITSFLCELSIPTPPNNNWIIGSWNDPQQWNWNNTTYLGCTIINSGPNPGDFSFSGVPDTIINIITHLQNINLANKITNKQLHFKKGLDGISWGANDRNGIEKSKRQSFIHF